MYFGYVHKVESSHMRLCFRCAIDPVVVKDTSARFVDTEDFVNHGYSVLQLRPEAPEAHYVVVVEQLFGMDHGHNFKDQLMEIKEIKHVML